MELQEITMSKAEARRRLDQYRAGLRRKADAEWSAAGEAYRQLANGHPLVDLDRVFQRAPVDERGRPRLAIARADRPQVHFQWERGETRAVFNASARSWHPAPGLAVTVGLGVTPKLGENQYRLEGWSLVPMVPPSAGAHALASHHVLWEVEEWANSILRATPDRDPYLLRHLRGTLWVVVASWDLTDIERAVMDGRRLA
ncbi:MAG: hypothetical protein PHS14_16525 [Elusimicrobia bacterium]|nr:hypothetical protein [Elusimicrobiota bacterium]